MCDRVNDLKNIIESANPKAFIQDMLFKCDALNCICKLLKLGDGFDDLDKCQELHAKDILLKPYEKAVNQLKILCVELACVFVEGNEDNQFHTFERLREMATVTGNHTAIIKLMIAVFSNNPLLCEKCPRELLVFTVAKVTFHEDSMRCISDSNCKLQL